MKHNVFFILLKFNFNKQIRILFQAAHMSVIEMIMLLYTKEVVTTDRVLAAVQRFSHGESPAPVVPENQEQALLLWVGHACEALRRREEQKTEVSNGGDVSKRNNDTLYYFIESRKLEISHDFEIRNTFT